MMPLLYNCVHEFGTCALLYTTVLHVKWVPFPFFTCSTVVYSSTGIPNSCTQLYSTGIIVPHALNCDWTVYWTTVLYTELHCILNTVYWLWSCCILTTMLWSRVLARTMHATVAGEIMYMCSVTVIQLYSVQLYSSVQFIQLHWVRARNMLPMPVHCMTVLYIWGREREPTSYV